jgi:predicted amidophosphoribosyltransferase
MTDPTAADRARRYRERRAGRLPPAPQPVCPGCGITHTGARGPFCSRCFERLDEDGKKYKAERVRKARKKRKRSEL